MSLHNSLKASTSNRAKALELASNLGSFEKGKLEDLIVLDKNPLVNIKNSISIRYKMKNGVLYDGETLDKLYPVKVAVAIPWWQMEEED